jgi:hypothetical protein
MDNLEDILSINDIQECVSKIEEPNQKYGIEDER